MTRLPDKRSDVSGDLHTIDVNGTLGSGTRDRAGQEFLESTTNEKQTPAAPRVAMSNEAGRRGQEGPVPRREAKGPDPGGDEGAAPPTKSSTTPSLVRGLRSHDV